MDESSTLTLQTDLRQARSTERAILEALAYSDIFDSPLTAGEIHRYLPGVRASLEEVVQALEETPLTKIGNFFTLHGREGIVAVRSEREASSRKLLPRAIRYGRVLGTLPYIRMVALTGSLAVMNSSKDTDFDYMLVAARGRLWMARALALAFNRLVQPFSHTICPNLIIAESALEWTPRDFYSARELCQMIPITGMDVYHKLMEANEWVKEHLPNAFPESRGLRLGTAQVPASPFQKLLELPLNGKLGDRLERWEMTRKIARFSKQQGFGEETIFNAEMCQGNFHHHRKRTREVFEERMRVIASEAIPSLIGEVASLDSQ